ncbi:hypothetical protein [Aureibacter tunicatorum]|uniref:Uncharacterized protein n=1 Tax=Aureibacter tunicatorum TaxID=866807 RepID=A0AAE3XQ13_9BACT|nr:hypothetical protein [Aureibacter tunicatorum]MDR6239993.1 hypothetical protein [Aureibacter tunicatorum]BDD04465.1 hypothetical protein AUTU_19480 [Aureibacter tunicatorum]
MRVPEDSILKAIIKETKEVNEKRANFSNSPFKEDDYFQYLSLGLPLKRALIDSIQESKLLEGKHFVSVELYDDSGFKNDFLATLSQLQSQFSERQLKTFEDEHLESLSDELLKEDLNEAVFSLINLCRR